MVELLNSPPPGFFNTTILGLDLETSGLDPHQERTLLISLNNGRQTIVVRPGPWVKRRLFKALEKVTLVGQNLAFDIRFLRALGWQGWPKQVWDTMVIEQICTAGLSEPVDLASIAWRRASTFIDKGNWAKTFVNHDGRDFSDGQLQYAYNDVDCLLEIMYGQRDVVKRDGLEETATLENDLVPVVAQMEYIGVGFDHEQWRRVVDAEMPVMEAAKRETLLALKLDNYTVTLFGGDVGGLNLNSTPQVLDALRRAGVRVNSTQAPVLLAYIERHPEAASIVKPLLRYREVMHKIGFDYPKYVNSATGRVHTSYWQAHAATGRFSSRHPNLQNVPYDLKYRLLFVAHPGWQLMTADWSQQEARIAAIITGDPALIEACRKSDVHAAIAAILYNDPTIVKGHPLRRTAKNCTFAAIYGAGSERMAETAGIPLAEATDAVYRIKRKFPTAMEWGTRQVSLLEERGYTVTLGGRRRWFVHHSDDDSFYAEARNTPIQGTGVDMLKRSMVSIAQAFRERGLRSRLVLTVHDELVTEIPDDELGVAPAIVVQEMEAAGQYYLPGIPTPVDWRIDRTWGDPNRED